MEFEPYMLMVLFSDRAFLRETTASPSRFGTDDDDTTTTTLTKA